MHFPFNCRPVQYLTLYSHTATHSANIKWLLSLPHVADLQGTGFKR